MMIDYPSIMMQHQDVMSGYMNLSQCQQLCDNVKAHMNNELVLFLGVNIAYWLINYIIVKWKPGYMMIAEYSSIFMVLLTVILLGVT